MYTDAQKAARLRMAVNALEDAEAWVVQALGDSDVARDGQERIQGLIEDLRYDIMELEGVE